MKYIRFLPVLLIAACSHVPQSEPVNFFAQLRTLCNQNFEGTVTSTDPEDESWRGEDIMLGPVKCLPDEVRLPLAVGADKSRTWIVSEIPGGVRLKHDHRHEADFPDDVSNYGGDSIAPMSELRREFPVDQFSIDLFQQEGLTASVTNVWTLDLDPDDSLTYELRRENRFFQLVFPLYADEKS